MQKDINKYKKLREWTFIFHEAFNNNNLCNKIINCKLEYYNNNVCKIIILKMMIVLIFLLKNNKN